MSRPRLDRQLWLIAALPTALVSVTLAACTGAHAGPGPPRPSATAPRASPTGPPAEHVYGPAPTSQASSARTRYPPPHPPFSDPRLVALAEAAVVCNFDWRQTLAARIARARAFASEAYAVAITPSATDRENWQRTQQDRESAECSAARAFVMSSAPNSPTVRYERVEMTQQVHAASSAPNTQGFAVTYRIEWQSDGRWLVGADGEGG